MNKLKSLILQKTTSTKTGRDSGVEFMSVESFPDWGGWTEKGSQCSATSRREVAGKFEEKIHRNPFKPALDARIIFVIVVSLVLATSLLSVASVTKQNASKSGCEVLLDQI